MQRKYLAPLAMVLGVAIEIVSVQAQGGPADSKTKSRCSQYARAAVHDFQVMNDHAKCRLPGDMRWHANYQAHYNWCLTAQTDWVRSEGKARDDHLIRCGVRGTL